jgi:hypothetical protein
MTSNKVPKYRKLILELIIGRSRTSHDCYCYAPLSYNI